MRIEYGRPSPFAAEQQANKSAQTHGSSEMQGSAQPVRETVQRIKKNQALLQTQKQQFEQSNEQANAESEKMNKLLICLLISRRIIAGDKVPSADHRYLIKHDPALYARSISMRIPKSNPHEYKRASRDEQQSDLQSNAVDGSQGCDRLFKESDRTQERLDLVLDITI